MFKAGDPRVEVMPEAFAIPRLIGELVPAFFRVDEFGQPFQLLPGMSRVSFAMLTRKATGRIQIPLLLVR